ncbi:MAG: Ig-like domain-containing protein [Saprospiraceae bacterium]|nr:Ig-like domain-containing protein [Saprospiraceae bacterium]
MGVPQPSDGVYHVGDEISFTFNQDINCNRVQEITNVELIDATTNQTMDIVATCVGNKIVIDPSFVNSTFENKILRAELHNIQDLTGNIMIEAEWEFYVDRNELAWLTDSVEIVKFVDESKTISAKIHNRGGYPVPYSIIDVPEWLHVFPDKGTLVANEIEEIFFTVNTEMELGDTSSNITLKTETGVNPFFMGGEEPLNIRARNLCRPETWVLNPAGFNTGDYDFSMNFILRLNIKGTFIHR